MKRKPQTILSEIRGLVDELEAAMGGNPSPRKKTSSRRSSSSYVPKGALGAITMLFEEGFFESPKEIGALMEKLKEIGHYHDRSAVSMNLLNLTRRRVLNRFKNKDTKNWEYVIRK